MEGHFGIVVHRQCFIFFYLLHLPGRHSCLVPVNRHDCPLHFHLYHSMYTKLIVIWDVDVIMSCHWQMKQRTSTCSAIQLKQLAQRHRIIRMLFFILIGFFICYMPFTISIIVRNKVVLGNSINSVSIEFDHTVNDN